MADLPHPTARLTSRSHHLATDTPRGLSSLDAAMERTDGEPSHDLPNLAPAPVRAGEHPPVCDGAASGNTRRHVRTAKGEAYAFALD